MALVSWSASLITDCDRMCCRRAGMPPWGVAIGCGLGVPCIAAESRVRAAVLGLHGSTALAETAARITVPMQFLVS